MYYSFKLLWFGGNLLYDNSNSYKELREQMFQIFQTSLIELTTVFKQDLHYLNFFPLSLSLYILIHFSLFFSGTD